MSLHRILSVQVAVGLLFVIVAATTSVCHAQITFTDIAAGLLGVVESSAAWGDYDNDGDLDILLTGYTGSERISRVYRNDGGAFTDIGAGLTGVDESSVAWGDYDNDGDLDILLTGGTDFEPISSVYRNDGGSFTDIVAGLPGVSHSSVTWGDYDNDGDLDILLTGGTDFEPISSVYRNDGGLFTDIGAGLTGVYSSSVAWGDYDNDGDLDILLTGYSYSGRISRVYRNDAGTFTDIGAGLDGVASSSVAWGDYDNDGDLDILLTGDSDSGYISNVYRNDGGLFTDIAAGLTGVDYGSVAWGDYDNDGDLDILLTGYTGSVRISSVYRNDGGGTFTDISAGLTGVSEGSVAWGDYDNDGDLDILLTGWTGAEIISRVYRTDGGSANTPPAAPGDLSASVVGCQVTFSWTASTDTQTPAAGLSYNLRVGTTPGGSETVSPMADASTGYRRVVELGNAQQRTSWTVTVAFLRETYYWSVQAVDGAYAGSAFAAEDSVDVIPFTDIAAGLTGVIGSSVAWGDYDNDGDLDILLTGQTASLAFVSSVYRNDGGVFTDIAAGLTAVCAGSAAWGDYDNDGDLDILLTGLEDSSYDRISRVYRNDAGAFTDTAAGLPGVDYSSVAWGDFDNDGDLDILLTGSSDSGKISRVYRNDGGVFTDIAVPLTGVWNGSAAWGDYDNDGDLDILLTGWTGSERISCVYRNDAGVFTDIGAGLEGVNSSSVAWGDFDNDADLDILLTGALSEGPYRTSCVYRNDAGAFTDISAPLTGVDRSSVAWGDCDNDGDLDILLTGDSDSGYISNVYRNDGGLFTDIAAGLTGVGGGSVAWGDYDNDGDLDLLLTGDSASGRISSVYRNDGAPANTPPAAPGDLSASVLGDQVTLSWSASTDAQTPAAGLSYNLRVGTTPGGTETVSPMADGASGYRRVVEMGNAEQRTSWTLTLPFIWETYHWSVQAVDGAYAGSAFATEESVECMGEYARIDGIVDIPNDQGRQVRISWSRSWYDFLGSPTPIAEYAVYRKIDDDLRSSLPLSREDVESDAKSWSLYPPGEWDFITTVPARCEDEYAVVAPTLADSTITEGMYYTTFFVSALSETSGIYFDSLPDSGYSVDNLEPQAPRGLTAEQAGEAIVLNWDESLEEDFDYYAVYRGEESGFPLGDPIGYSITPTYTDDDLPGPDEYWYRITATDFSGNESDPSDEASAATTDVASETVIPTVFYLGPAIPNPFNPITEISYGIPLEASLSRVILSVYTATGREVTTLVDQVQGPGEYRVVWDGRDQKGAEVASGVYFYRLTWNGSSETRRMVLLK